MSSTKPVSPTPHTDDHIARGDWNPLWDTLREWDPQFMEAYLAFRSVPHASGPLPTIQLTTVLGIHACNLAVPILAEELNKLPPSSEA